MLGPTGISAQADIALDNARLFKVARIFGAIYDRGKLCAGPFELDDGREFAVIHRRAVPAAHAQSSFVASGDASVRNNSADFPFNSA